MRYPTEGKRGGRGVIGNALFAYYEWIRKRFGLGHSAAVNIVCFSVQVSLVVGAIAIDQLVR